MIATEAEVWHVANQRYLAAALAGVTDALRQYIARLSGEPAPEGRAQMGLDEVARDMPAPPALELLCSMFDLSAFEREVLLLCAGMELSGSFGQLCAAAQGDPQQAHPTFSLALAALPG